MKQAVEDFRMQESDKYNKLLLKKNEEIDMLNAELRKLIDGSEVSKQNLRDIITREDEELRKYAEIIHSLEKEKDSLRLVLFEKEKHVLEQGA